MRGIDKASEFKRFETSGKTRERGVVGRAVCEPGSKQRQGLGRQ